MILKYENLCFRVFRILSSLSLGLLFDSLSLVHLLALMSLDNRVCDNGGDEADGADSVIVSGDNVICIVGIAVGVNDSDYRYAELLRFNKGVVLLEWLNDEN